MGAVFFCSRARLSATVIRICSTTSEPGSVVVIASPTSCMRSRSRLVTRRLSRSHASAKSRAKVTHAAKAKARIACVTKTKASACLRNVITPSGVPSADVTALQASTKGPASRKRGDFQAGVLSGGRKSSVCNPARSNSSVSSCGVFSLRRSPKTTALNCAYRSARSRSRSIASGSKNCRAARPETTTKIKNNAVIGARICQASTDPGSGPDLASESGMAG